MAMTEHDIRLRLKAATKSLTQASGGIEATAAEIGRSKTQVAAWSDPRETETIPVWHAARLEARTGTCFVTRAMADIAGLALGEPGTPATPPKADPLAALANAAQDTAMLSASIAAAAADGHYSVAELRAIRANADEVVREAGIIRHIAIGLEAAGGGKVGGR